MTHALAAPPQSAPDFDRLAAVYRWLEYATFGPFLARRRSAFLSEVRHCRRGLVLGDGDGRFTASLLAANSSVGIDAVDASPAMLHALLCRAGSHSSRVRVCPADARRWQPPVAAYDLVATHFFLDCLTGEEVGGLAKTLRPALAPSALWLVSEFAVPAGAFGRLLARPLIALLYWIFARLTGLRVRRLPDHRSALREAGFALLRSETSLHGLLISELWALP